MKKKQAPKRRKRSKLETVTAAIVQDFTHLSTQDISRRRIVLSCEQHANEHEINELVAKLSLARQVRSRLEAQAIGLGIVIERRCITL